LRTAGGRFLLEAVIEQRRLEWVRRIGRYPSIRRILGRFRYRNIRLSSAFASFGKELFIELAYLPIKTVELAYRS